MSARKTTITALSIAALSGLLAGTAQAKTHEHSGLKAHKSAVARGAAADAHEGEHNSCKGKHDCKGKNSCKGQGGCESGDHGCKGKNSCKGKGGCNTAEPHE